MEELVLKEDELFSSDSETEAGPSTKKTKPPTKEEIQEKINKQEKIAFTMQEFYRADLIFMLDMLEIPWVECPAGFEAEQIAAISTYDESIFGIKMDYVFSPDLDGILFAAKKLIKRDTRKKKLFEYDLDSLLQKYELSQQDLIKIGLILGSDFAPKTPKIGPKSVLKKYKTVELTTEQTNALNTIFNRKITKDELKSMDVKNIDKTPFTNNEKYKEMLDWLELVKSYNRERISKQFKKNKLFVDVD
jgi:flap endonuclease-1